MPINADRVKEAPAQALRAVFAGIGQLLLTADKMRKRGAGPESGTPAGERSAPADAPGTGDPAAGSGSAPAGAAPRSLDQTGNVRLLTGEDQRKAAAAAPEPEAAEPEAAEAEAAEAEAELVIVTEPEPESEAEAELLVVTEPAADPAEAELPVPNYDSLSLPSLRARLRSLDAAQLGVLVEYERAHAARADVLAMFERRIAKLAADR
jgi:hypothetical protein